MVADKDCTILVCCHKEGYYHSGPGFLPIQVGKSLSSYDLGIKGDDTGDNISSFNPNFCELTAHYWYWKNCDLTKFIGLNHYRRYFDFNFSTPSVDSSKNVTEQEIESKFPKLPDLDKIFLNHDIILAKPKRYPFTIELHYRFFHITEDYKILEDTLLEKYPWYSESFKSTMKDSNMLSPYNMFVMSKKVFEDYSAWLFDILFEVANKIKISGYPNQARVFGYMAERLLNVYVHHNKLRPYFVPVLKVSEKKNNESVFKKYLRNIGCEFLYRILHLAYRLK